MCDTVDCIPVHHHSLFGFSSKKYILLCNLFHVTLEGYCVFTSLKPIYIYIYISQMSKSVCHALRSTVNMIPILYVSTYLHNAYTLARLLFPQLNNLY